MSGIIVYKSKYGATKKYAEWISEETGFKVKEASEVSKLDFAKYDTIIFGSGIYMSKLSIAYLIEKNYEFLSDKNLIVFGVGSCPFDEENIKTIVSSSFDKFKNIPFFYCRGIIHVNNMNLMDKILCKMLQKVLTKKSLEERTLLEDTIATSGVDLNDWTDKKYIDPILNKIEDFTYVSES